MKQETGLPVKRYAKIYKNKKCLKRYFRNEDISAIKLPSARENETLAESFCGSPYQQQ